MSTIEASSTIFDGIDAFDTWSKNHGYGPRTGARKMFSEKTGKSEQYISHILTGQEHGRKAYATLNQIFLIVGYNGANWVIHR